MDLYRLTIQDSQDSMQFDLLDAPIKIEDVEGAVDNTVLSGDIFTDFLYLKKRWEQKWAIMCKDEYERLRGFYTRQWSLATVPSVKVTQGYLKDTEWEGQIFYINAPYGGEVSALTEMTGDTFQQSYTGKNLAHFVPKTSNGYTPRYDSDTGTIYVSGTNTNTWSNIGETVATSIPAGTYTISVDNPSPSFRYNIRLAYADSTYVNARLGKGSTSAQVTVAQNVVSMYAFFDAIDPSTTLNDWAFKLQLEAGSTATPFEKFVGGQPSPNPEFPQSIHTVTGTQTITINGQAFTIDLGDIELCKFGAYQDYIYKDGESWKVHKETAHDTRDVQINGIRGNTSLDTVASTKGAFSIISSQSGWVGDYATTLGIATLSANIGQFKLDTSVTNNLMAEDMQDGTFCQRQGANDRCYFKATSLIGKTGNEVRAILAPQGGVNAWWGLQTPTETTITDTSLIAQLEAVRAALLEGQNLVEVTANGSNLPAKSITLQGIEGRENPILPQTNVRIGLSDGGVLNACECRQNVTLSMRETA